MAVLTATTRKDRSNIKGRTLYDMAKKAIAEARIVQAYIDKSSKWKDGKITPSGKQWEDYLQFCRFKMAQAGATADTAIDLEEKDSEDVDKDSGGEIPKPPEDKNEERKIAAQPKALTEDEEAELIKDWESSETFPGYMAWALWGHIPMPGLESFKCKAFEMDDTGSAVGRKSLRKAATKEAALKREAATLQEDRGLSRNEAFRARELIAKTHASFTREQIAVTYDYDVSIQSLQSDIDDARSEVEGVQQLVFSNPALFEDHEASYSQSPFYKMWYDAKVKKETLQKEKAELVRQKNRALAELKIKHELTDAMPPPAPKRARQMSAASTTSKVPVKEVTTNVVERPESRLSAAISSVANNEEEQVSTDDQLQDPEMETDLDKELDKDETATPVVSEYVLLIGIMYHYVAGSGLSTLALTGQLISCFLNAISK
jgi:hypothetical protein